VNSIPCPLCEQIPPVSTADLIAQEGELPEVCEQLLGWPGSFGAPLERELRCPECDGRYWLMIETGGMEWDLRLIRRPSP
tara:strand:- start:450 stop:689 length:240 start_codon:yes stop_codon:yes gene_type:complete